MHAIEFYTTPSGEVIIKVTGTAGAPVKGIGYRLYSAFSRGAGRVLSGSLHGTP